MKALFRLKDAITGKPVKDKNFGNKLEAKAERDRLWKEAGSPVINLEIENKPKETKPNFPFLVTYGPDHIKFHQR